MLPLAQWHINTSPTAALGGRCPYWARFGIMPNVSQMPPLSALFKLMGFSRSVVKMDRGSEAVYRRGIEERCRLPNLLECPLIAGSTCAVHPSRVCVVCPCSPVTPLVFTLNRSSREAAVLPFDVGGLLPEPAAAKKKGAKKRPAPVADSDEEAEEVEAAGAAMLMELGMGTGKRPRRQGAGAKMGAMIADELELGQGEEEAGPSRALPARAAALSSPAGTRRQLQLSARPFEEWMQEMEDPDAAGSIPDDEGGPGSSKALL